MLGPGQESKSLITEHKEWDLNYLHFSSCLTNPQVDHYQTTIQPSTSPFMLI